MLRPAAIPCLTRAYIPPRREAFHPNRHPERVCRPRRFASMGKRKSKARVITMKKPVLAKKFKCPFCCTPDSCEVAL